MKIKCAYPKKRYYLFFGGFFNLKHCRASNAKRSLRIFADKLEHWLLIIFAMYAQTSLCKNDGTPEAPTARTTTSKHMSQHSVK